MLNFKERDAIKAEKKKNYEELFESISNQFAQGEVGVYA